MARPLRVYNTSDLREMTDEEIKSKIVPLILKNWATLDTHNRGDVIIDHNTPNIGSVFDRERAGGIVGHHPVSGSYSNTNRGGLNQNKNTISYSVDSFLHSESSSNLKDINEAGLQSDILRCCAEVWGNVGTNTGVGSYALSRNNPSGSYGGTWEQVSVSSGTNSLYEDDDLGGRTWYLWRKTHGAYPGAAGNAEQTTSQYIPVKTKGTGGDLIQMTDANILTWVNAWRTYITDGTGGNGVGTYILKLGGAPATGSWTLMGVYEDILRDTSNVAYAGFYTANYAGNYTRYWAGVNHGTYTGYYFGGRTHYYTGLTIMSSYISNDYNFFRRIG